MMRTRLANIGKAAVSKSATGHADATPRFRRNGRPRRRAILAVAWSLPTLVYLVVLPDRPIVAVAGETRTNRIHIEFVSPTKHQELYELL